jgi:two-component system nitrogen regulation response regulator NtrX
VFEEKDGAVQEPGMTIAPGTSLKQAKSDFEKSFILDRLQENQWNVSRTADAIGIERSNLHKKLRGYGIDPKRLKGE